jgi:predicted nucleic acid-binding Zn ribbon protein
MERAKDILGRALRGMKDPEAARAWLAANWQLIAGEMVARHTLPLALQDGVFRIEADSVPWMRQVESMGTTICERINRAWGGKLVSRIRIEEAQRRGKPISYAEDNLHTPFIRRPAEHDKP